eukprot:TRINITY_DN7003_c0_g1_i4.p2 TRINITY_DN7003_c0_g1~~TRINITY_DN7003_c0_g1_i4.p2  ORF type:complete len:355 (+),score=49.17 TRINITY_DN7003_c0_g1_i4:1046-2110(+)
MRAFPIRGLCREMGKFGKLVVASFFNTSQERFLAPELSSKFKWNEHGLKQAMSWYVGCMVLQILSVKELDHTMSSELKNGTIQDLKELWNYFDMDYDETLNLFTHCLNHHPSKRPDITTLVYMMKTYCDKNKVDTKMFERYINVNLTREHPFNIKNKLMSSNGDQMKVYLAGTGSLTADFRNKEVKGSATIAFDARTFMVAEFEDGRPHGAGHIRFDDLVLVGRFEDGLFKDLMRVAVQGIGKDGVYFTNNDLSVFKAFNRFKDVLNSITSQDIVLRDAQNRVHVLFFDSRDGSIRKRIVIDHERYCAWVFGRKDAEIDFYFYVDKVPIMFARYLAQGKRTYMCTTVYLSLIHI